MCLRLAVHKLLLATDALGFIFYSNITFYVYANLDTLLTRDRQYSNKCLKVSVILYFYDFESRSVPRHSTVRSVIISNIKITTAQTVRH